MFFLFNGNITSKSFVSRCFTTGQCHDDMKFSRFNIKKLDNFLWIISVCSKKLLDSRCGWLDTFCQMAATFLPRRGWVPVGPPNWGRTGGDKFAESHVYQARLQRGCD